MATLRRMLEARRAGLEESFRIHAIEDTVQKIARDEREVDQRGVKLLAFSGSMWGERLAALHAEEELVSLVQSSNPDLMRVGGHGLVAMDRADRLMELLALTPFPATLIDAALEANRFRALKDLSRQGRISPEVILKHAVALHLADVVADLIAPEDAWPRRLSESTEEALQMAVDSLATQGATDRLVRVVQLYESDAAVRALVQLRAFEQILGALTLWPSGPARTATAELYRLTGIPETTGSSPTWPTYLEEQEALIQRWRAALLP
ncbi:MAG: hypothetical protein V2A76_00240 [Planctomycetota bacterium]